MSERGDRRLSRRVLQWFLGEAEAESVLDELEELRAHRRRTVGRFRAELYYRAECALYPLRLAFESLRRGDESSAKRGVWLRGGRDDMGQALRMVVRNPVATGLAALVLALCIGANAAIFSVVKGVLLDALPYPQPDRLTAVWLEGVGGRRLRVTPGNYTDLASLSDVFAAVGAFGAADATISADGLAPELISGSAVTASYFRALGVRPLLGRTFRDAEQQQGAAPVVVLSHALWSRWLGADSSAIGSRVMLDGTAREVIGVMPRGIYPMKATVSAQIPFLSADQDFWVPLQYAPALWANRRPHVLGVIARLRDGISLERTEQAVSALGERVQAESPPNAGERFRLTPFRDEVVGEVRVVLLLLMGSVGLVLLIAMANVAGLLIVRTDTRGREFAVRSAVGATAWRLARQTLLESVTLAMLGVIGGVALAYVSLSALRSAVPFEIPRLEESTIDSTVLAVSVLAGFMAALLFGIVPALHASRVHGGTLIGRTGRGVSLDARRRRAHAWAVGIQAALVVMVTVGATLLVRSFRSLQTVDPGFAHGETLVLPVRATAAAMPQIRDQLAAIPGVASVAVAYDHPLSRNWEDAFRRLDGTYEQGASASLRPVGSGYFETVGIEVLEGRGFEESDRAGGRGVAVVNRALAERHFAAGGALGASIEIPTAQRVFGDTAPASYQIVGIVENVRFLGLDGPAEPALYVSLNQFPVGGQLLVRPSGQAESLIPVLRTRLAELDPTLAFPVVRSLDDMLSERLARPRFNMLLIASFAGLGLILCALGIYSLTGRAVAARFREIGIRTALGARRGGLLARLLGSTLIPVLAGTALGTAGAAVFSRTLRSLLFGVSPQDPVTLTLTPILVLLVGVLGAMLPALRAVLRNPAAVLNSE